ncbi:MAG TPA: phosphoribosylformylglycinamidine synthase subunit PurQ [Candidatus Hydrothermia bacterium]|nr:phosphoribosylformylglycinamidine synthase subunit PurQ [Candidatus Hydrothermae bacterium]MDD3648630.1 phosphoribosylformylglycinamidine synthase subunit PurQ [Candidatus Hydrothermia bacterium]MDD5573338.1 phosphoribosylformylglycinamidine synthase subunit PurQ [Candidatus Hydrothermia bacterium]HOK22510.1 phosphoribosylformylglycinamidine synthase subunit PurQ [Candidatus Hydrothermia bacterium]HOL23217.1 phosphoribosylformylglycinamidine synthase subunit PurQ [Candidatus Hydrothermia bac
MKVGVVIFPGTNCDSETYYALKELVGFDTGFVWHEEVDIRKYSLIILPGGFSYGDYLRPGALAKVSPVVESLYEYVEKERGIVVGICNGFQILTESRLLKGGLIRNSGLKFICKTVPLRVVNNNLPFTRKFSKGEVIKLTIAHMDGRYVAPPQELEELNRDGLVFLEYDKENPNGSILNIAGITNERRNVFGLMPHPERNVEKIHGTRDGLKFFQSLKEFYYYG